MAALSVERARLGKATRRLRRAASAVKRARSSRLAATPPVTRMRVSAKGFLGGKGLLNEVADDSVLEAGDEVEGLRIAGGECIFDGGLRRSAGAGEERFAAGFGFRAKVVELDVAENRRFDS